MDNYLSLLSLQIIESYNHPYVAHWLRPHSSGYLLLAETAGKEHENITELITQWALRGSFFLIVGGEWLPDQDNLRRSVRRCTTAVKETLDNIILARPSTCLQLRDQLKDAHLQNHPILILDFLHYFYDPDVELSLRLRVLEECCQSLENLSRSNPVFMVVEYLPVEEYERFFPVLVSIADEILAVEAENSQHETLQSSLF